MTTKKAIAKKAKPIKKEVIKGVPSVPPKSFFVSMLTRDIDLQDSILDLLDNCVDGAIRSRSKRLADEDSLEGFWAHIQFDEEKFSIEDNCGGIPWDLAKKYAFCMGKPEGVKPEGVKGQIGVVGIGMKRAIFKMGRDCLVHSHHKKDTFLVTIPPEWFKNDQKWEFFEAEREKPISKQFGTTIEIRELTDGARLAFAPGSSFREDFAAEVARSYSYLIEKGFTVKIGRTVVKRKPVKLCFEALSNPTKKGTLIRPYVYEARINDVDVYVSVGYRSRLLTQEEQDESASGKSFAAKDAGWTIVCNDRVVLSNDQTVKTGWGVPGVPSFHNQFACIAGIAEFSSDNMADLPITTTKRGIDTSKDLYTYVRARMQEGLKLFTRNTNKWKGFEKELKNRFDGTKVLDLRELKRVSKKLTMVPLQGKGMQRHYKPRLPEKKKSDTSRRISFIKEIDDIEQVSQYLFEETRRPDDVGEKCFDTVLVEARK